MLPQECTTEDLIKYNEAAMEGVEFITIVSLNQVLPSVHILVRSIIELYHVSKVKRWAKRGNCALRCQSACTCSASILVRSTFYSCPAANLKLIQAYP